MKPIRFLSAPPAETTVRAAVAAYGVVRAGADKIPLLRQIPGPPGRPSFPTGFLKHCDEQTILGLSAVFQAMVSHDLMKTSFSDWGVLGAPRFFGRAVLANALQRFALEGAWGVSPHLIPHRSLHSLSGSVSQALGIHGPNLGVGGGPQAISEVMTAAGALLAENRVPGLWIVMTGWEPEPILDRQGMPYQNGYVPPPSVCHGIALALTAASSRSRGLEFLLGPRSEDLPLHSSGHPCGQVSPLTLESFSEALATGIPRLGRWELATGGWMELVGRAEGASNRGS